MYRSLFQHVFSTEYVYVYDAQHCSLRAARQLTSPSFFRSSKQPQVPQSNPQIKATNIHAHIHFASGAQSNETVVMSARASVFMPTDHIQPEFSSDVSIAKDLDVNPLPPSKEAHSPAPLSPDIEQQARGQFEQTPYYLGDGHRGEQ
jgi:hypothetical protein